MAWVLAIATATAFTGALVATGSVAWLGQPSGAGQWVPLVATAVMAGTGAALVPVVLAAVALPSVAAWGAHTAVRAARPAHRTETPSSPASIVVSPNPNPVRLMTHVAHGVLLRQLAADAVPVVGPWNTALRASRAVAPALWQARVVAGLPRLRDTLQQDARRALWLRATLLTAAATLGMASAVALLLGGAGSAALGIVTVGWLGLSAGAAVGVLAVLLAGAALTAGLGALLIHAVLPVALAQQAAAVHGSRPHKHKRHDGHHTHLR